MSPNPAWIAVIVSALSVLLTFWFNKRKSGADDEASLTERIARSKAAEAEIRKIAEATCRESFSGRTPWVKDIAREVFRDQQQVLMNEGTFVDGKTWKEFRGGLGDDLNDLKKAIEDLRRVLADQPKSFRDLLIEIRRDDRKI